MEMVRKKPRMMDKGGLRFVNFVLGGEESTGGGMECWIPLVIGSCKMISAYTVSTGNSDYQPETRYCHLVSIFQGCYSSCADRAVRGENRGGLGLWAEVKQVPGSGGRRSTARMANIVLLVEMGCRGFVGQSTWRDLRVIGVTSVDRRQLIGRLRWHRCGCGGRETSSGKYNISYIMCMDTL